MPRNVRNFWIELEVDGRRTKVACGPAARDGGFTLTISMRNRGNVVRDVLEVRGLADDSGKLRILAETSSQGDVFAEAVPFGVSLESRR